MQLYVLWQFYALDEKQSHKSDPIFFVENYANLHDH